MYTGNTAPWLLFHAWDTDDAPFDTLDASTTGLTASVFRTNLADVSIASFSDAASATDWAAGKIHQVGANLYAMGVSTASISGAAGSIVGIKGTFTGGYLTAVSVELSAYNPAGNPNTIAPATLADVQGELPTNFGDLLINASGHIERVVLVDTTTTNTDMRGTEDASTHSAADVLTAFGTGTWATAIPWNAAWDTEVQSEVNDALVALDLDSALIAQGAERAVNVDVNHRVHSHVYDMQANTITASALAADAGAEIYAAFGTGSNLTALATQAVVNDIPTNAEFAAAFPANFASLGINVSGHVSRVTLVDTTTTNTDMRGTDSALTDKSGFALSATGLDLVTSWTTDITGSLSGNVGGIAGTINTLDELDTAQDTQHGTTRTAVDDAFTVIKGATWSGTTDTLEAIRDRGDVAWITGAGGGGGGGGGELTLSEEDRQLIIDGTINGVTAHRSRIQNAVYGSYTLTAGDTWDQTFDVATAGATRVLVAIKKKITDTDDQSLLLLDDVTGLLRVNKLAAADAAEGEVIADGTTVRAVVDSAATLLIPPGTYSVYVKYLSASRDSTPEYKGELKVEAAGIRIVS
jgi:hypothetical protein